MKNQNKQTLTKNNFLRIKQRYKYKSFKMGALKELICEGKVLFLNKENEATQKYYLSIFLLQLFYLCCIIFLFNLKNNADKILSFHRPYSKFLYNRFK